MIAIKILIVSSHFILPWISWVIHTNNCLYANVNKYKNSVWIHIVETIIEIFSTDNLLFITLPSLKWYTHTHEI